MYGNKYLIEVKVVLNAMFCVELDSGYFVLAHIPGRIRMNFIRIIPSDRVKGELYPYELSRGRVTFSSK